MNPGDDEFREFHRRRVRRLGYLLGVVAVITAVFLVVFGPALLGWERRSVEVLVMLTGTSSFVYLWFTRGGLRC